MERNQPPRPAPTRWWHPLLRQRKLGSTVFVSFAIVGLQLLQGILISRLLGPTGRGVYATAMIYTQAFLYMGLLGCHEVICRYAAGNHTDLMPLRRSALRVGLITGGLTTIVVVVANFIALPANPQEFTTLGLVCAGSILGQHLILMLTAVDRGSDQFRRFNLLRLIASAAMPMLLLGFGFFAHLSVTTVCWISVIASFLGALICVPWGRLFWIGPSHPKPSEILHEGRHYALSMIGVELFERLDLLLIVWLAALDIRGFYSAMIPVAYPLTVLPNTLGMFLFNKGAREKNGLSAAQLRRVLAMSSSFQVASTIGFLLLVRPVVRLVYGDAFLPAVEYAMWLAPVAALRGITQGLDAYLRGRGLPLSIVPSRIFACAIMVIYVCIFFARGGAVVIPQAALIGQIICLVWLVVLIAKDIRRGISKNDASSDPIAETV